MSISALRSTLSAAAGAALALGLAGTVAAEQTPLPPPPLAFDALGEPLPPGPEPEPNPDLDVPGLDLAAPPLPPGPFPPACAAADEAAVGITVVDNGDGTALVQLGYYDTEDACDAEVRVTSYRTDAADSIHEELADWTTNVDALEAAAGGDGWLETGIELDPCFATVAVSVGDDVLESERFGDGCEITITKDFPDGPWAAAISLRHGRGWTPDHIFEVGDDDVVVWTGLPNGPYVVNEFDGVVDATTIAIDGADPAAYDGGDVAVAIGQSVVFTNPAPDRDPDPDPDPDTEPDDDRPLAYTGSSATVALSALGLLSGVSGLGLLAAARRRR